MVDSFFLVSAEKDILFYKTSEDTNSSIILEYNQENLDNWIDKIKLDHFADQDYSKCRVFTASSRYTLVPNTIFLPTLSFNIFETSFGANKKWEQVYFNFINEYQATIVFGKPYLVDTIKKSLNNEPKTSHIVASICNYLKSSAGHDRPLIFIIRREVYFFLQSNDKLKICSNFEYQTTEDIAYFILSNFKSYDLKAIDNIDICSLNEKINSHELVELFKKISLTQSIDLRDLPINKLLK